MTGSGRSPQVVTEARAVTHERAVAVIARTVRDRGYPPTMSELAAELGYRHRSSVHQVLVELEQLGRIRRGGGPRAITIVEAS